MSILQMSVAGGVMVCVILIARALLLERLPKKTFLLLWELVLVRLLVPVRIPSRFSIYSRMGRVSGAIDHLQGDGAWKIPLPEPGTGLGAEVGTGVSAAEGGGLQVAGGGQILFWLWLTGLMVCVVIFLGVYLRCLREFRTSLPLQNAFLENWCRTHRLSRKLEIRQSDQVGTPISYGILHPVILLPKSLNWTDERSVAYILEHEYVHIRRFDLIAKLVMLAGVCIHWFNPFVWFMWILFNRDVELSCDEKVIRSFGENTRFSYAMTLIGMEERKMGLVPFYNGFGKNAIQERIKLLMKSKKITIAATLGAVLLVAAVGIGFATSAGGQNGENGEPFLQESKEAGKNEEAGDTERNSGSGNGNDLEGAGSDKAAGENGNIGEYTASTKVPDVVRETAENLVGEIFGSQEDDTYVNWRISSLDLVYQYGGLEIGDVEIYRLNYLFLAENPEEVVLAGGMEMDEGGWVIPGYADSTYLVFERIGEDCKYLTWMMENDCVPGDELFMEELKALITMDKLEGELEMEISNALTQTEADQGQESVAGGEAADESQRQAAQMALVFSMAYFQGDKEKMRPYLADGYSDEPEIYGEDREVTIQQIKNIKAAIGRQPGDVIELSVEAAEEGSDTLKYLTLECVMQEDGWKVRFYGLEG